MSGMEVTSAAQDGGSLVNFLFRGLAPGICPEDNAGGTLSALEKLAHSVEARLQAPGE